MNYRERAMGIPSRYYDATLTGRETTATRETALYLKDDLAAGRALIFLGGTGRGKTYAACAALLSLPETDKRQTQYFGAWSGNRRFIGWREFLSTVEPFAESDDKWRAMDCARQSGLIVLDEVTDTDSARLNGFTDEIISYRQANILPTIITCNIPPADLSKRLGERIASRFAPEWATVVLCDGDDLRQA